MVARGGGVVESYCLMDTEFLSGENEKVLEMGGGDGCTRLSCHCI